MPNDFRTHLCPFNNKQIALSNVSQNRMHISESPFKNSFLLLGVEDLSR